MSRVSNQLVPMVVESDGRYERSFDIFSRLLRERIVFLDTDIRLYVNSPGGDAYAGFAIYDAMQFVKPDVQTYAVGMAMSAGALILAGGAAPPPRGGGGQPLRPADREVNHPAGPGRLPRNPREHPDPPRGDPRNP